MNTLEINIWLKLNEKIKDLDYAELKKIKLLDTKETIPKFEDVLKLIKDKILIDIEIKDTKKIKETCEILMNELIIFEISS